MIGHTIWSSFLNYEKIKSETQQHGLPSKLCMKKIHGSWGFIGGNLGAVAWLLPSLSLPSGTLYIEGFWEENFHWIFFSEGHLEAYRASWASWWLFGYCFWETNILWLCALPLIVKVKKTFLRFQMEAHVAYTCKQILGLCHSPPQMEYQVKVENTIKREKNLHKKWC